MSNSRKIYTNGVHYWRGTENKLTFVSVNMRGRKLTIFTVVLRSCAIGSIIIHATDFWYTTSGKLRTQKSVSGLHACVGIPTNAIIIIIIIINERHSNIIVNRSTSRLQQQQKLLGKWKWVTPQFSC